MPDEKRQIDPKPLSPEYHRAHKQLMLWAAILFIWELVGIDLEKAKEAGGNAAAIINAIKSPQAIPWALLILVVYFLIKTNIEWFQCSLPRRTLRVARIDFAISWLVPLGACLLYAYQAVRKVQIADVVQNETQTSSWRLTGITLALFNAFFAVYVYKGRYRQRRTSKSWKWHSRTVMLTVVSIFISLNPVLLFWLLGRPVAWRRIAEGFLLGLAFLFLGVFIYRAVLPWAKKMFMKFALVRPDADQ